MTDKFDVDIKAEKRAEFLQEQREVRADLMRKYDEVEFD